MLSNDRLGSADAYPSVSGKCANTDADWAGAMPVFEMCIRDRPIPPYAVYNIGNNHPENLLDFVDILQQELVRAGVLPQEYDFEAHKELVAMQPGDVPVTYADTSALERDFGFKPATPLRDGLRKFAEWYKEFYMGKEE